MRSRARTRPAAAASARTAFEAVSRRQPAIGVGCRQRRGLRCSFRPAGVAWRRGLATRNGCRCVCVRPSCMHALADRRCHCAPARAAKLSRRGGVASLLHLLCLSCASHQQPLARAPAYTNLGGRHPHHGACCCVPTAVPSRALLLLGWLAGVGA
jgi:hypothetical protein